MKIGELQFKAFAAKKPLLITPEGSFVSVQQVADTPSLGLGSLFTLSEELQTRLAIERYSMEPDFQLAILQAGLYSRDEIIDNIKRGTAFGKLATRAEMGYCDELAASLADA